MTPLPPAESAGGCLAAKGTAKGTDGSVPFLQGEVRMMRISHAAGSDLILRRRERRLSDYDVAVAADDGYSDLVV
jgi:hypothetical protein